MKIPPISREQARRVDQIAVEQYGIAGVVLMENAGRGAAEAIDRVAPEGNVVILAGKGNNAGDGYVIARHLQLYDRNVRIVSLVALAELRGDALINAKIASAAELEIVETDCETEIQCAIAGAAVIVDCLLGTGAIGPLRGPYASTVRTANRSDATRVAIDVPSGMDCDTGEINDPTFLADHTFTFVAPKLGFAEAKSHVGNIEVISIGVPRSLLRDVVDAT